MATGKKYYWIKLKDSFMTSDTIDYLMGQEGGANYVVLYQMLCLKTINTQGRLARQIGEVIIPYDAEKICRDCKWFSMDTIRVALTVFQKLGLIYQDDDGTLRMTDFDNLVGSETDYAIQKRNQRHLVDKGVDNVHTDIDIRYRDKDIDKDIYINNNISSSLLNSNTKVYTEKPDGEEDNKTEYRTVYEPTSKDLDLIVSTWNSMNVTQKITGIPLMQKRYSDTRMCIGHDFEGFLSQIRNLDNQQWFVYELESSGRKVKYDWFVNPNNYLKVCEGNYSQGYVKGVSGNSNGNSVLEEWANEHSGI